MGNIVRFVFNRISNFLALFLKFFKRKDRKNGKQDKNQEDVIDMSRQDQQLLAQYSQIIEQKVKIEQKSQADYCQIAFAYANIAMIHAHYGSQQYQKHKKSALSIYNPFINQYYEQKITLLNNIALSLDKFGRQQESGALYEQALQLCERYLPIADERTLVVRNNIALSNQAHEEVRLGSNMLYAVQRQKQEEKGRHDNLIEDSLNTAQRSNCSYYYSQDASNQMNQSSKNRVNDLV